MNPVRHLPVAEQKPSITATVSWSASKSGIGRVLCAAQDLPVDVWTQFFAGHKAACDALDVGALGSGDGLAFLEGPLMNGHGRYADGTRKVGCTPALA